MSEKQFGLAWLPVSGHHKSVCIRAGFSPCKFYHIGHSKFFCSASITPWIRSIFLLNSGLAILQLSHESINKKNKQIEAMYNKANLRDLIAATSLVISNWIQIVNFSVHVTKKFDGCPRKTTEHLTSSILSQALCVISNPLVNSNWIYRPETLNSGRNWWYVIPCDLEIWWMTLENNRAPLLCYFKFCAAFRSHWWIQTGVTVWKRQIWVKFDGF